MATPQPKPAPAPPPVPPTDAQLRADLAAEKEKNARLEAQANSYLGAARSEWERAERAQEALRGIRDQAKTTKERDPFERLSTEGLALDADKQQELLDRGVRGRVREEIGNFAQENERRELARQYQLETKLAINMFKAQHPSIAQDVEGFGAAMTRAQIRAGRENLNPDPVTLLNMALSIYNEGRSTGDTVPFTEGASVPGGPSVQTTPPPGKPPVSIWKKLYGATNVVDESDENWSLDSMTEQYLDRKNLELVKEGFTTNVGQIMMQLEEAKARREASAA